MERALILAAALAIAGCGPTHVRVPDSRPMMQAPPEDAMQPCPTAEREGLGDGVVPDVPENPTRAQVLAAATAAARYIRVCDERHRTLRGEIEAYLEAQRRED